MNIQSAIRRSAELLLSENLKYYASTFQKKYAQAAELYHQCSLSTPVKQLQAFALERYGRCLVYTKKYDKARQVYWRLLDEFGQFKNRVGYPYRVVAAIQLYNVARQQKIEIEKDFLKIFMDVF